MADEILLKNTPFSFTPINKTITSYVFVLPTVEISCYPDSLPCPNYAKQVELKQSLVSVIVSDALS